MFFFLQSSLDLRVIESHLDLKQELFQCLWFSPSKACSVPSDLHAASEGLLFSVGFTLAEHMKSSLDGGWLSAVKCDTDLHLPLALTPAPCNSHHAPKNEFRKPFDTSSSRSHSARGEHVIYSQGASVLSTMGCSFAPVGFSWEANRCDKLGHNVPTTSNTGSSWTINRSWEPYKALFLCLTELKRHIFRACWCILAKKNHKIK